MAFTTSKSLLSRIKAGDELGWEQFHEAYSPLIRLRGGDLGLGGADLDDLAQNVVLSVFEGRSVFRYDPAKGRFRDYLRRIISNKAVDIIRRKAAGPVELDPEAVIADERDDLKGKWDEEWREHVLRQSLDELRRQVEPATFQAFDLYAVKGLPGRRVAEILGVSEESVYTTKNRCMARLKLIVKELED